MAHGYSSDHLAACFHLFARCRQLGGGLQQAAALAPAVTCATRLRLHPAWLVASFQTTTDVRQIPTCAASQACQNQSELFCFEQCQDLEYQLDDAVGFQR